MSDLRADLGKHLRTYACKVTDKNISAADLERIAVMAVKYIQDSGRLVTDEQDEVLKASAVVLLRWSGGGGSRGWDVSAIHRLSNAFSDLPPGEHGRLVGFAEEVIEREVRALEERIAKFDAEFAAKANQA